MRLLLNLPAQPAYNGVLQTGQAIGTLSSSNNLTAATGPSFSSGQTLELLFTVSPVGAGTYVLWRNNDGSFAGGHGWEISLSSAGALGQDGELLLRFYGANSGAGFLWSTGVIMTPGLHAIAFVYTSTLRLSVDGSFVNNTVTAVPSSYVAPGGSSVHAIGTGIAGGGYTVGQVLHAKAYSVALTDAVVETTCGMGADNRYSLIPSVANEASVTFDWRASRDWNGSSSVTTSQGSSPVPFNVNGSPTLDTVSERWYPWSSLFPSYVSDSSTTSDPWGVWARIQLRTTDTLITIDNTVESSALIGVGADIPVFTVDGSGLATYVGVTVSAPLVSTRRASVVSFGGSGTQQLEIWNGAQQKPSSTVLGVTIQGFRLSASGSHSLVSPVTPTNRVVIAGDSITADGSLSTVWGRDGAGTKYRNAVRPNTGVTLDGWGFASLYDMCTAQYGSVSAYAAHLVALAQKKLITGTNLIVVALMTNDYYLAKQSASAYQTMLTTLLTDIHADDPSIPAVVHGMTITNQEATANSFGNVPDDYRTAASNAVAAMGVANITFVNYKNVIVTADLSGDPVHPNTTGHGKIEARYKADFGF